MATATRAPLAEWRVGAEAVVAGLAARATDTQKAFSDAWGQTAVTMLVEAGHGEALAALLAKPPPPNLAGAVLAAATHGRTAMLPVLFRAGAAMGETDSRGSSALHRAAENNHAETARVLIEMGVPVDGVDRLHRTPMHVAVLAGAAAVLLVLLQAGADMGATDDVGRTPADMDELLRAGGGASGVDDAALAAVVQLFKDELEASLARGSGGGGGGGGGAGGGGEDDGGAAEAVIMGITDLDSLVAVLLAKFHASITQHMASSYEAIFRMLDSRNTGACSQADLVSGALEVGVEVTPELARPLLERVAGRPGADAVTLPEFLAFCKLAEVAGADAEEEVDDVAAPAAVGRGAGRAAAAAPSRPAAVPSVALPAATSSRSVPALGLSLPSSRSPRAAAALAAAEAAMAAPPVPSTGRSADGGGGGGGGGGDTERTSNTEAADLAADLQHRLLEGLQNDEQPSREAYFRQFDTKHAGHFGLAEMVDTCELLGLNGTPEQWAAMMEYVWGSVHYGVRGAAMRIHLPEFLQFCSGLLPGK